MARYVSASDNIIQKIDKVIFEAVDLGLDPIEIDRIVQECIAWSVKELGKIK